MIRTTLTAACLLLAGCSAGSEEADEAATPVALVTLAPVTAGGAANQLTVYGAAEPGAMGKISLVAPAEARVVAIEAAVGTPVAAGQIVSRLVASPTTQADAAKATSDAAAANAALARAQRLRADGLGSDAEVETARAAATAANAVRTSVTTKAGSLTLRAPAAGTVDAIPVAVGELLQAGAPVASIARNGEVRVRFGVDPDAIRGVRPGMVVRIEGAATRAPLVAILQSVSPVIDPQTRLAAVYARVPAGSGITAGEVLTGAIDLGDSAGATALTIPYTALLDDAGQPFVYVVRGGVAHRRDIVVEPSSGERVTIVKGLIPGERVVIEGSTGLEDGMKVRTR